MKTSMTPPLIASVCACLLLAPCGPPASASGLAFQAKPQGGDAPFIVRVAAEGDELSILFPARPSAYRFEPRTSYATGGEVIMEERVSVAYADGVVYVLRLQKAGSPGRALREYAAAGRREEKRHPVSRQELKVGRNVVQPEEYRGKSEENGEPHYTKTQYFTTRRYLCIVSATARDGATPQMNDFFSSLRFGDPSAAGTGAADSPPQVEGRPGGPPAFKGEVYEAKEVTRPALVVWQPPLYLQLLGAATDLDRNRFEIRVQATLTADGEVADVKVLRSMSHDVVAIATEMTRHAKFIPALLNGRPVSQRYTFKYNLWSSV